MRAFLPLFAFAAATAFAQSGFDITSLDRKADPCGNFYQFACGGWMAANPIPADVSRWGRFDALQEQNRNVLKTILETAAKESSSRSAREQKIGDFYASCMDEPQLERKSMDTLQRDVNRIAVINNKSDLPALMSTMYKMGVWYFFSFTSEQDAKNAGQMIAGLDQGGLGLPDRDYYSKTDAKSVETREKYLEHVQKMFQLLGQDAAKAKQSAAQVMAIETALADGSLDRVSRRDPEKIYHKTTIDDLKKLAPSFDWSAYMAGVGAPKVATLNIEVPAFITAFNKTLDAQSLDAIKNYMTWHLVNSNQVGLSAAIRQEHFNFYDKYLRGSKEMRPRWKVCVDTTDAMLPDALGQEFIAKTLGAEGIKRTADMVNAIEAALERDIKTLDWMTPDTKTKAVEKLHKIANKIGNQAKWQDYKDVAVRRDDFYGNAARASQHEAARELAKIGKKVDKSEWHMSQPTVNAYYDPQNNDINFPAGILQPPFYNNKADDAINFGGIGAVIGHELTHGFDDEGRQFDGNGNLKDWWTPADAKAFDERASCVVNEYGGFSPLEGVNLNGKLTLGENTADNGGLRIAYMALMDQIEKKPAPEKIDGFTAEQRFFLGWAQVWCQNVTSEQLRLRAQTDPHSPGEFRVNGVVRNMPEFGKAFSCGPTATMTKGPACRVW